MATTLQDKNGIQLPSFNASLESGQNTSASNSALGRTSLDLEQNPFEQSFAPSSVSNKSSSTLTNGVTSPILTPGGRKLPPLVLSPNVPSSWSTTGFPRTGLTPNESSLRSGLTPGDSNFSNSLNGITIHGINTPGSLAFPNFTPGLSSILGNKEFDHQLQSAQRNINDPNVTTSTIPVSNQLVNKENVKPADFNAATSTTDPVRSTPQVDEEALRAKLQRPKPDSSSTVKKARKKSITSKRDTTEPRPKKIKLSDTQVISSQPAKSKKSKAPEPKVDDEDDNEGEDDENINDDGLTEEEKRKQFLERNRVAASKCRQRKKQQLIKMENDLNFYLNEYNNLTGSIDQLKDQAMILRTHFINNKVTNPNMLTGLENILQILNQTNYVSRMRGNNPSNLIPTVQPINPVLVQQNQQIAALNAAVAAANNGVPQINNIPVVAGAATGSTAAANNGANGGIGAPLGPDGLIKPEPLI